MENIQTKIKEIQNYFTEKIYNYEFDKFVIEKNSPNWYDFTVTIDGYIFNFAINCRYKLSCLHTNSLMKLTIDNSRIGKLIEFITNENGKILSDKIEMLKSELAKLETI